VVRDVKHVGVIKTQLLERVETRVTLGLFCNNDGRHFVRELTECPMQEGMNVPLVKKETTELEWMRMRT
jgi:hypothetical protein